MKKLFTVGTLVAALVGLVAFVAVRQPAQAEESFRSGIFDPPRAAPAFTLDGSNGSKLSLSDHLGKVVILEFGYTSCEYVCPVTLARLKEVQDRLTGIHDKLGSAAGDVQLIYVTVDPKRDTPERLREYLAAFNPSFLGATGTPDELAAVLQSYGVVAQQVAAKNPALEYSVDHSSFIYLVDRQGMLRGLVPFGTPADDIVHDVGLLMKMQK